MNQAHFFCFGSLRLLTCMSEANLERLLGSCCLPLLFCLEISSARNSIAVVLHFVPRLTYHFRSLRFIRSRLCSGCLDSHCAQALSQVFHCRHGFSPSWTATQGGLESPYFACHSLQDLRATPCRLGHRRAPPVFNPPLKNNLYRRPG